MTPLCIALLLMAAGRGGSVPLSHAVAATGGLDAGPSAVALVRLGFGEIKGGRGSGKPQTLRLTAAGETQAASLGVAVLRPETDARSAVRDELARRRPVTTTELAKAAGCSPRLVLMVLAECEQRGEATRLPGRPFRWAAGRAA